MEDAGGEAPSAGGGGAPSALHAPADAGTTVEDRLAGVERRLGRLERAVESSVQRILALLAVQQLAARSAAPRAPAADGGRDDGRAPRAAGAVAGVKRRAGAGGGAPDVGARDAPAKSARASVEGVGRWTEWWKWSATDNVPADEGAEDLRRHARAIGLAVPATQATQLASAEAAADGDADSEDVRRAFRAALTAFVARVERELCGGAAAAPRRKAAGADDAGNGAATAAAAGAGDAAAASTAPAYGASGNLLNWLRRFHDSPHHESQPELSAGVAALWRHAARLRVPVPPAPAAALANVWHRYDAQTAAFPSALEALVLAVEAARFGGAAAAPRTTTRRGDCVLGGTRELCLRGSRPCPPTAAAAARPRRCAVRRSLRHALRRWRRARARAEAALATATKLGTTPGPPPHQRAAPSL